MLPFETNRFFRLSGLALILLSAPLARGAVAVSFDGVNQNYVTAARSLIRDSGITHTVGYDRPFSTQRMQPNGSQYSGPTFFGGFVNNTSPNEYFLRAAVLEPSEWPDAGGREAIQFAYQVQNSNHLSTRFNVAILFDAAEMFTLGEGSTIDFSAKRTNVAMYAYPIIRAGGQYYVYNNATVLGASYQNTSLDLVDDPANWSSFVPSGLSNPSFGSAMTTMPANIDAIGLLLRSGTMSSYGTSSVELSQFSVNAVVPEPELGALVLGLAALWFVRRRRA